MRNLKKQLRPDIERALIADAADSDAWEPPISVPPFSKSVPERIGKKIPIGLGIAANQHQVDHRKVFDFITRSVTGTAVYAHAPGGIAAGAVDFYLVVGTVASVASIANVLWMAYDRFIAPTKDDQMREPPYILLVVQQVDTPVNVRLGDDVLTKDDFVDWLETHIAEASAPKSRLAQARKIRELEDSELWIRINDVDH